MPSKKLALERLHRNGVITPFPSAEMCVRNLAGIQAQVQQFAELAVWNRCSGLLSMQKLSAAYRSHAFINLWGQRNTLHMYAAADWDMICDIYHNRMYIQRDISAHPEFFQNIPEQFVAMSSKGKLSRTQIHQWVEEHAPAQLKESEWLTYMILNYLCANGLLFGVPAKPSVQNFVCFSALGGDQWQWKTEKFAASLSEMMLRYFKYYGPATIHDFSTGRACR